MYQGLRFALNSGRPVFPCSRKILDFSWKTGHSRKKNIPERSYRNLDSTDVLPSYIYISKISQENRKTENFSLAGLLMRHPNCFYD